MYILFSQFAASALSFGADEIDAKQLVYMYIYICIFIYIFIYTFIYMYEYMYVYIYVFIHGISQFAASALSFGADEIDATQMVYMYIYIYIYICVYVCLYL
jgi:hypothetical protein